MECEAKLTVEVPGLVGPEGQTSAIVVTAKFSKTVFKSPAGRAVIFADLAMSLDLMLKQCKLE